MFSVAPDILLGGGRWQSHASQTWNLVTPLFPSYGTWVPIPPATDIWWSSLKTCSNLGGTHPIGRLSCFSLANDLSLKSQSFRGLKYSPVIIFHPNLFRLKLNAWDSFSVCTCTFILVICYVFEQLIEPDTRGKRAN